MNYHFGELSVFEYGNFENKHPQGNFIQSAEQKSLLEKRGEKVALLGLKDDTGKIVAGAVVTWAKVKLGNLFSIERGPLLDYSNEQVIKAFISGLTIFAEKHAGLFIRIRPNIAYAKYTEKGKLIGEKNTDIAEKLNSMAVDHQLPQIGFSTSSEPEWQFVKDLTEVDPKQVVKSYNRQAKYHLNKNKQFGVKLRQISKDELPAFKRITQQTADRLHYHDKSLDFYETLFDTYGEKAKFIFAEINFKNYLESIEKDLTNIQKSLTEIIGQDYHNISDLSTFSASAKRHLSEGLKTETALQKRLEEAKKMRQEAKQDIVLVSVALFVVENQEVVYLYSGSDEKYEDLFAPYEIQDTMITEAVKKSIPLYNFYGVSGKFDGSDGVLGFKTHFNGYTREMVGSFDFPVQKTKYRFYRLLKKILRRQ
ncbi:aminoacyltransferase [Oenococcus sp. UCMA 16435]|nr:aminoacyltransferase [Oenococcus sp. UCMA 16435]MDI4583552.1 peptidoglycan bridge formation glycyltransferase FemA/FemB family protein [Oenococcus sp. UCMA 14587]MDN6967747.1 aminoacyltransferase [Oenococcus sp. UCMA 17063]